MAQGETQGCDVRRGQKASQGQTMPSLVGRGWALNLTLSVVGLEKTYMFEKPQFDVYVENRLCSY